MKTKSIIAAVLLTIGLLVCFSAAGSMDAGASWIEGAIRGAVGIIFMSAGAILSRGMEFHEENDDRSECFERCEVPDCLRMPCAFGADLSQGDNLCSLGNKIDISEQEDAL